MVSTKRQSIGQRATKIDALERVTGRAVYGADVQLPGMLHGKILRSKHPHARIHRIDFSKALDLPSVIAIITNEDVLEIRSHNEGHTPESTKINKSGSYAPGHEEEAITDRPSSAKTILAGAKALWVGQPIAAVAAMSVEAAEEAISLIEIDYEVLSPILTAEEGIQPEAPILHRNLFTSTLGEKPTEPSNIATHIELAKGDVEEGFKQADVVIEDTYRTAMVHQGYLEPRATLAKVESNGKVTVWSSTQGSFGVQKQLSESLGIPLNLINVIPVEIGGGFGSKGQGVLEPMAVLLARKAGRPVKMVMNRAEEFQAGRPAAPSVIHLKIGVTKQGILTAVTSKVIMDGGAFPGGPVAAATSVGLGHYKFPNLRVDGFDVVTNKPPVGAYRAPGTPQAVFALESHIDRLANAVGMDPLEFRLQNIASEGDRLPTNVPLPVIGFRETLEKVQKHPAWNTGKLGPNQGRGMACGMWLGGIQPNSATIRLNTDGTFALVVGVPDLTGTRTTFVQMAAEELEVGTNDISITVGNTETAPFGATAAGSKTTYTMSVAIKIACDAIKAELLKRASITLDLPEDQLEYADGSVRAKDDPEHLATIKDLGEASITSTGGPIVQTGVSSRLPQAPSFATHVVDVEVDPETGKVRILKYTAFQDCGFAINPTQVEGQMQGGVVQGIGWALNEGYVFDQGTMRNPTWLDYRMPTALDLPMIDSELVEVANPAGPYGIRGVGEVPIVPPMAAIANAISNATGTRLLDLPMNPERVLMATLKNSK